jgi:glgC: glucose-1-phosphate adenylyltransferase
VEQQMRFIRTSTLLIIMIQTISSYYLETRSVQWIMQKCFSIIKKKMQIVQSLFWMLHMKKQNVLESWIQMKMNVFMNSKKNQQNQRVQKLLWVSISLNGNWSVSIWSMMEMIQSQNMILVRTLFQEC